MPRWVARWVLGRCLGGYWVDRSGWEIGDGGVRSRDNRAYGLMGVI